MRQEFTASYELMEFTTKDHFVALTMKLAEMPTTRTRSWKIHSCVHFIPIVHICLKRLYTSLVDDDNEHDGDDAAMGLTF